MNIGLAGGKTGGHIIPLIKIATEIKKKNPDINIYYFGYLDSLEQSIVKKNPDIIFIPIKLNSNLRVNNLKEYYLEYKRLKDEIKTLKLDKLISSGGYVSLIPLFCVKSLKIDYYLLEENMVMGRTIKLFKRKAKKVFLTFPLKKMSSNMIVSGSPSSAICINKDEYPLSNKYINIIIIGGSLGSKILCDIGINLSKQLMNKYKIIIIAGNYFKDIYFHQNENLIIYEYVSNLYNLMANCDIIISRAGSSTISEALALSKPLIIIPSLKSKDNHQFKNAKYVTDAGAAVMILEDKIDYNELIYKISSLYYDQDIIMKMKSNQKLITKSNVINIIINEAGI